MESFGEEPSASRSPAGLTPRSVSLAAGTSPVGSDRSIAVRAKVLAIIALIALIPTVVNALSLRGQVSELRADVSSLKDRVVVAEVSRELLEEEVKAARADVAERFRDILDASAVVERIDDAVFTIQGERGLGSGFGIRSSGGATWIATNHHVIEGSVRGARVTVRNGYASWSGTVERWDKDADVALIKVEESLPVLVSAYEAGHPPAVGDAVLAYGSPYGLEGTATVGIVSAFRSAYFRIPRYIQTDAPINPGNSGGPLVNAYGDVLGLTTSSVRGGGIGFVVDIRELCSRLLEGDCGR